MSEGDNVSMGGLYFNKINPTYKGGLSVHLDKSNLTVWEAALNLFYAFG